MIRYRRKPEYLNSYWWVEWCSENKVPQDAIFGVIDNSFYYEGRHLMHGTPDMSCMQVVGSDKTFKDFL